MPSAALTLGFRCIDCCSAFSHTLSPAPPLRRATPPKHRFTASTWLHHCIFHSHLGSSTLRPSSCPPSSALPQRTMRWASGRTGCSRRAWASSAWQRAACRKIPLCTSTSEKCTSIAHASGVCHRYRVIRPSVTSPQNGLNVTHGAIQVIKVTTSARACKSQPTSRLFRRAECPRSTGFAATFTIWCSKDRPHCPEDTAPCATPSPSPFTFLPPLF